MNKEIIRNVRLGIFVIAGGILLVFGLYSIGKNKNLFGKSTRLVSIFYDANGLMAGNNVRYSGIDVGTVDKIEIVNDTSIMVEMLIEEKAIVFIRKNSIASVGTDGLMGNKIVNISPGTKTALMVENGDTIPALRTVNTEEMLRTLDRTNNNISIVSDNIRRITDDVTNSHGLLYKVTMDTALSESIDEMFRSLNAVSNNLETTTDYFTKITYDLREGKGALGMILSDTGMSSQLRTAMNNITEGSRQFRELTTELNTTIAKIDSGDGVVSSLINDTILRNNLASTIANMQSASIKLNEDLEAMKHSFLLRGYFKDVERAKEK